MKRYAARSFLARVSLCLPVISLLLTLNSLSARAQVLPGSLVVYDNLAGSALTGAVSVVGPSGERHILSDFRNRAQGPQLAGNHDMAIAPSGRIFFPTGAEVFEIHPITGNRASVTDGTDTDQGPEASSFVGLAADSQGRIYASGLEIPPPPNSQVRALFRIDRETGQRVVVSRFDDPDEGPEVLRGDRLLLENDDSLLILDRSGNSIIRVDLNTGERTQVTNFLDGAQGPTAQTLSGFGLEPDGNILVTSFSTRLLFRVFAATGEREIVTDLADGAFGPVVRVAEGVVARASGEICVLDSQAELSLFREGAIICLDKDTQQRTVFTDFSDDGQGPTGFKPTGIAVAVPVVPTEEDLKLVRSVVIAAEQLKVQKGVVVNTGNLYANDASGKVVINKAATTPAQYEVGGNALSIKKQAVVNGDVVVGNRLDNRGTVNGEETIADFPVFLDGLPPLQQAVTGDANVQVNKSGFLSLPPGRFNNISIKKDAVLVLEGGVYEAAALKAAKRAEILYEAPVVIRLSGAAKLGKDSVFGPAEGSSLDAKSAVLHVNDGFKTGNAASVDANIISPGGNCKFGKFSHLTGFAYCRTVSLGKSSEATLRNFLEDSVVTE